MSRLGHEPDKAIARHYSRRLGSDAFGDAQKIGRFWGFSLIFSFLPAGKKKLNLILHQNNPAGSAATSQLKISNSLRGAALPPPPTV